MMLILGLLQLLLVLASTAVLAQQPPPIMPTVFRYPSFANRPKLALVGNARPEVHDIVLAGPGRRQTGAMWFTHQPFLHLDQGFFTEFTTAGNLQKDNSGKYGFAFVIQCEAEQTLGEGDTGYGYSGLGEGLAVEFSPNSIDVQDALFPSSKLLSHKDKTVSLPKLMAQPLRIRLDFHDRVLRIEVFAIKTGKLVVDHSMQLPHSFVSPNGYYVGFTASTGKSSAARFAIKSWKFGLVKNEPAGCVRGFNGPECGMTDDQAAAECPRRTTCLACVNEAYNCVWCGSQCMAGNQECAKKKRLVLEDLGCSSGLNWMWLWIALGLAAIVLCFGSVLVRVLNKKEAKRAVSLLVSLACGALGGMVTSLLVSASLVEISTTPQFALAYAMLFFYLAYLVFREVWDAEQWPKRSMWENFASTASVALVVVAGVLCLVLDKHIVMWLPEAVKVMSFMVLACALTFCVVFAAVDAYHELCRRLFPTRPTGMTAGGEDGSHRVLTVARNKAVYALLILASLVSGLYFGLVFGLMRIEEETVYRASLLLLREAVYTFPFGAVVGGLCGLLIQFISILPRADADYDVERIIDEARDDL